MGVLDPDDDPDEPPFRDPLPPDDRLWRHPSELDDDPVVIPDPVEPPFPERPPGS